LGLGRIFIWFVTRLHNPAQFPTQLVFFPHNLPPRSHTIFSPTLSEDLQFQRFGRKVKVLFKNVAKNSATATIITEVKGLTKQLPHVGLI